MKVTDEIDYDEWDRELASAVDDGSSIFENGRDIVKGSHFRISIRSARTHEQAFYLLTYYVLDTRTIDIGHIVHRGYKVLMRPADTPPDKVLWKMMKKASPIGPIYCMKDYVGWVFFGAK
jgi:hypothetical protein